MLLRGGAVAALLLAAADWTRAQSVTGAQATVTTEEAATPGWIFAPSIGVGASHDSNVLLLAVPDDPPRDSGMPVTPHARLDYGGRRTNFGAGYDGSFLLHQDLRELNSSDHQVGAHFRHRLSRHATLFGQENLTHASTTAGLMISGVPFYRLGSVSNAIGGGVDVLLSRRTTLHSSYSHDLVSFDSFDRPPATPPLAGGYSHDVTASLSQAISPTVTIGGDYEITRAVLADGEDRFFIHTTTMTVEFHASRQVVLSGFAGVSHVTASATQDPHTGPALRAAVTRRDRRTLLMASVTRERSCRLTASAARSRTSSGRAFCVCLSGAIVRMSREASPNSTTNRLIRRRRNSGRSSLAGFSDTGPRDGSTSRRSIGAPSRTCGGSFVATNSVYR